MAVTYKGKVKQTLKPVEVSVGDNVKEITQDKAVVTAVDEFVEAYATVTKLKAKLKLEEAAMEEVKGGIRQYVSDQGLKPDEETVLQGTKKDVQVGMMGMKVTDVNKAKLLALVGEETFIAMASFTIGDLRSYLTPKQLEQVITEERVNARVLKVVNKAKAKKAK